MTEADSKYGEELRSALCAAADVVVPVGDGLEKIRVRTARRLPVLDWLHGYFPYVPQQAAYRLRMAGSWLAAAAGRAERSGGPGARHRTAGFRPGPNHKPVQWLRPALAAAGALVIVISVALAIPRLRENVFAQSAGNTSSAGGPYASPGGNSGPGGPASAGSQPLKSAGVPGFGTKSHRAMSSCSEAASSGSGGSRGSGGSGSSSTGTGPQTYPPPETGPSGATPGVQAGGIDSSAGTNVDAYMAQLMVDMPDPQGSGSSITTYPAPCAPGTTPPVVRTTHPTTPTSTPPTSTPPTSTPPTSTPPTSTPPTSTPPTSTPPTSSSPTPTGDGGGSTAPTPGGPTPTGTASPG